LATDPASIALAEEFWKDGKVVSAICHGPAALVNVKDQAGKPIVQGREVTAFSNADEEQVKMTHLIPFLVETRLRELGGKFEKNDQAFGPYVAVDGQLITGANPASGEGLGHALVKALAHN